MEVNIARNVYNDQYRNIFSYREFVNNLQKGIDLILHSVTFPADTDSMESIRIANEYRNQLRQKYPMGYETMF